MIIIMFVLWTTGLLLPNVLADLTYLSVIFNVNTFEIIFCIILIPKKTPAFTYVLSQFIFYILSRIVNKI